MKPEKGTPVLYRELVQFEPLDTVVQLKESAEIGEARRLVKTYN